MKAPLKCILINLCFHSIDRGMFRAVLPRYHVATRVGELDVWDGGDDFREEGSVGRVLGLFKHLRVRVTERGLAHITQPDCSLCRGLKLARGTDCFFPQLSITEIIHYLARRVDKEIALLGMELRGSDNLKEQHLLTPAPPRSAWVRQISPLWVPPCWQAWCRRCWRTDRWSPCATSWCEGHRQRDKFPGEKKDDIRKTQSGERYLVRVDRYWIDVVGVGIGKYPPENGNVSANYWKTIKNQIFKMNTDVSSTRPHLGLASTISSMGLRTGTLRALMELGSLWRMRVIVW